MPETEEDSDDVYDESEEDSDTNSSSDSDSTEEEVDNQLIFWEHFKSKYFILCL